MLSDSKLNLNTYKSINKNNVLNSSPLIRFGPSSIVKDKLKQNNDFQFDLAKFDYSEAQQLNDFINLIKNKEDILHIVALKVISNFIFLYNF